MKRLTVTLAFVTVVIVIAACAQLKKQARADDSAEPFVDWSRQVPGKSHRIHAASLPAPFESESVTNDADLIDRPADAWPQAPKDFKVELYSSDVRRPRLIRTAPNGDLFVVESWEGRIKVFRGTDDKGQAKQSGTFATGLRRPFGIAFYPLGPNPEWVYVANTDSVIRFPYKSGDLKARAAAQSVIDDVPGWGQLHGGGHWTRDIAFSPDGKKLYVSVGSRSNVDDPDTTPDEKNRACILEFAPEGKQTPPRIFASGIRNAVGIAFHPKTGELWASVNERDGLGDHLPPDYITSVKDGGFYGWPWYYIGGNQDPRHKGKHPELKAKTIVPDVLVQPHMASLQMTFYTGSAFPKEYHGDIFASQHGSWNRKMRAGYEVVRVPLHQKGKATGEYEDFLTGFVTKEGRVWGRPVGVTVGNDGALYVTDDGSSAIWRVSYIGK